MKFLSLITLIFFVVSGNIGTHKVNTGIAQNTASARQQSAPGYISAISGSSQQLYLLRDDGSNVTTLLDLDSKQMEINKAVWSPDGSRVALAINGNIFLMNADGTNLIKLTQDRTDEEPAWSPDGKKIAFIRSYGDKDELQIYVMGVDGAGVSQLTASLGSKLGPEWSPDGKHIAYRSYHSPQDPTQIYVMDADGSNSAGFTDGKFSNDLPSWSPDGKQIVFQSLRDGHWQIYVMNMDGSNQTNLSKSEFDDMAPRWSPDGKYIAFQRIQNFNEPGSKSLGVYVVRLDTTTTAYVQKTDNMDQVLAYDTYGFAWSPDSKRIVLALADMIHADSLYIADVSCLSSTEGCSSVPVTDFIKKYNLYDKLDHGIGNLVSWFLRKN